MSLFLLLLNLLQMVVRPYLNIDSFRRFKNKFIEQSHHLFLCDFLQGFNLFLPSLEIVVLVQNFLPISERLLPNCQILLDEVIYQSKFGLFHTFLSQWVNFISFEWQEELVYSVE